jgi:hypothetical protein
MMELTPVVLAQRTVMTIEPTPGDEKLIQERLRGGDSAPVPETPSASKKPRKNLADVLSAPPFGGSELNLERIRDYPRPLNL